MKTKPYIYVIAALIVVILIVIFMKTDEPNEVAVMPTNTATKTVATTPSPTPAPANSGTSVTKPVVYTTPTKPVAGSYQVHLTKGGAAVYYSPTTTVSDMIKVYNPPTNTIINSPVILSGLARGPWFFEGTAPIILTNSKGVIIARGVIKAQSDWMTNELVPFMGTLTFPAQGSGTSGVLVIKKDNPSGAAANDASIEILVGF